MAQSRAAATRKRTRIQRQKEEQILEAALSVFSERGFRGATLDEIAASAGLSKPNLLYYFSDKEDLHQRLLDRLLTHWLEPLSGLNPDGEPLEEILSYVQRKLELARRYPRESRLFANEILRGAHRLDSELSDLKTLVDEKATVVNAWIADGLLAECDAHHLIFSIWATTQHYADFDAQIRAVLGERGGEAQRFAEAELHLDRLFRRMLTPRSGA